MNNTGKLEYWQDEWVPSFKYRCYLSWLKLPSIPKALKVILLHGMLNPPEASNGNSGTWHRYIQLFPWIKEFYVE